MNIFFVIGDKVITPETSGSILEGITRKSIIELLKIKRGIEVEERALSIDEIIAAFQNGTLKEVFGTGTAALIANVSRIGHKGLDMDLDPDNFDLSLYIKAQINGLRDGTIEDTYGWMIPITEAVMA